jgi:hypothetical protein
MPLAATFQVMSLLFPDVLVLVTASPDPWWQVFGRFHPLLLHFPIVLILLGASWATVLWLLRRGEHPSSIVRGCLWGGLIGSAITAWAGWVLAEHQQEAGSLVDLHRWFAIAVVCAMVVTAVFDVMRASPRWPWAHGARLLSFLVAAILVAIAGHFGAEMKWGVGWVFAPLESVAAPSIDERTPPEVEEQTQSPSTGLETVRSDTTSTAVDTATAPTWSQVETILSAHCAECHGPDRQKAGLQLVPYTALFPDDDALWVVTPGDPDTSELFRRVSLPTDNEDSMPPDGPPLSAEDQLVLRQWIEAGALNAEGEAPAASTPPPTEAPGAAPVDTSAVVGSPDTGERSDPAAVQPAPIDATALASAVDGLRAQGIRVSALHVGSLWLEVNMARVQPPVTDADCAALVTLSPVLWSCSLAGTPLTDAAMTDIAACVQLRTLRLDHTAVSDAGLAALAPLQLLEVLNLFGTQVTDAATASIEGMASLRAVYLGDTAMTPQGLEALREARPDLAVHGNASLPKPPQVTPEGESTTAEAPAEPAEAPAEPAEAPAEPAEAKDG